MKAEPQNTEHANVEVSHLQTEASEVSAERPHRPRRIVQERNFASERGGGLQAAVHRVSPKESAELNRHQPYASKNLVGRNRGVDIS